MNVTLLKKSGSKEVINRVELADLASAIKNGIIKDAVRKTREVYHLMNPHRLDDGQITTQLEGGIKLPRICFVADYMNRKGDWRMMAYNGLVVLEVNDLQTYEKAVEIREQAKKLPETLMCFLGGSGRSVKIVCRGKLFDGSMPKGEKAIRQFHENGVRIDPAHDAPRRVLVRHAKFETTTTDVRHRPRKSVLQEDYPSNGREYPGSL